jgi:hypothetical protein
MKNHAMITALVLAGTLAPALAPTAAATCFYDCEPPTAALSTSEAVCEAPVAVVPTKPNDCRVCCSPPGGPVCCTEPDGQFHCYGDPPVDMAVLDGEVEACLASLPATSPLDEALECSADDGLPPSLVGLFVELLRALA